tara:strand:+ start:4387 stop:4716 length:330 start_codon:yes stop_codon:yes gene_type:complete
MDRQEHLITILGEECSELHQELCKALRFGLNDREPGNLLDNSQKIFSEFNDLMAMVEMVNESVKDTSFDKCKATYGDGGIMYIDKDMIEAKKEKVERFLSYSKERGTLD